MKEDALILYLFKKCGNMHPFRLSRIIALVDIEYIARKGYKLTELDYQKTPVAFYSDALSKVIQKLLNLGFLKKIPPANGKPGYLSLNITDLTTFEIKIPEDTEKLLDEILSKTCKMDNDALNALVVSSPHYADL